MLRGRRDRSAKDQKSNLQKKQPLPLDGFLEHRRASGTMPHWDDDEFIQSFNGDIDDCYDVGRGATPWRHREIWFYRPDGDWENKSIGWCKQNGMIHIQGDIWSGNWYWEDFPHAKEAIKRARREARRRERQVRQEMEDEARLEEERKEEKRSERFSMRNVKLFHELVEEIMLEEKTELRTRGSSLRPSLLDEAYGGYDQLCTTRALAELRRIDERDIEFAETEARKLREHDFPFSCTVCYKCKFLTEDELLYHHATRNSKAHKRYRRDNPHIIRPGHQEFHDLLERRVQTIVDLANTLPPHRDADTLYLCPLDILNYQREYKEFYEWISFSDTFVKDELILDYRRRSLEDKQLRRAMSRFLRRPIAPPMIESPVPAAMNRIETRTNEERPKLLPEFQSCSFGEEKEYPRSQAH